MGLCGSKYDKYGILVSSSQTLASQVLKIFKVSVLESTSSVSFVYLRACRKQSLQSSKLVALALTNHCNHNTCNTYEEQSSQSLVVFVLREGNHSNLQYLLYFHVAQEMFCFGGKTSVFFHLEVKTQKKK